MEKLEKNTKKAGNNNVITIENKTKNTSNMFDLVQGICELSGNKIIQSDENSTTLKSVNSHITQ